MENKLNPFLFVEYNHLPYLDGISADIQEVAAHFDKENIAPHKAYSLHTEYSYGKRKFDSSLVTKYPVLCASHKEGVPQLWKSGEWASSFADFITELVADNDSPTVIEIHPPFNDYCTMEEFATRYRAFEEKIHAHFPGVTIVIENRAGAVYHGGKFLISKARDIVALCQLIEAENLNLGLVLDFPQLLTAENIDPIKFKAEKYHAAIDAISPYRSHIKGIHLWGKKKSATGRWVAHSGTLDTYFGGNDAVKAQFLAGIWQICNDNVPRFLVPEVNSGADDLENIITDLINSKSVRF